MITLIFLTSQILPSAQMGWAFPEETVDPAGRIPEISISEVQATVSPSPSPTPAPVTEDHVAGQVIVKLAKGFWTGLQEIGHNLQDALKNGLENVAKAAGSLAQKLVDFGVKTAEKIFPSFKPDPQADEALDSIYLLEFDESEHTIDEVLTGLRSDKNLAYAVKNKTYDVPAEMQANGMEALGNAGNLDLSKLWGREKIDTEKAQKEFDLDKDGVLDPNEKRPGQGVKIAILDGGIFINHPDLFNSIYVREEEIKDILGGKADSNGDNRVDLNDIDGLQEVNGRLVWQKGDGKVTLEELKLVMNGRDDDGNGKVDDIIGWDVTTETWDIRNENWINEKGQEEEDWHGTHVAAIAAGVTGIASAATLIAVQTLQKGKINFLNLAKGLYYALQQGAHILNLSLGSEEFTPRGSPDFDFINDILNFAHRQGAVVVASAGNETQNASLISPANSDHVITVGAVDKNNQVADFSNYGPDVDIAAPGVDIVSADPQGTRRISGSGTSQAAPYVAGVAALLRSFDPTLTNDQIEKRIVESATPYTPHPSQYAGPGIVNAYNALKPPEINASGNILINDKAELGRGTIQIPLELSGASYKLEWGFFRPSDPNFSASRQNRGVFDFNFPTQWKTLSEGRITEANPTVTVDASSFPVAYLTYSALRLTVTDASGKSRVIEKKVYLRDNQPPQGKVVINQGAASTNSTRVTLSLEAADDWSGVYQMSFSQDGYHWTPWENFRSTKELDLTPLAGGRVVYFRVKDHFDSTAIYQSTIRYEPTTPQTPPTEEKVLFDQTELTVKKYASDLVIGYQGIEYRPSQDGLIRIPGLPPLQFGFGTDDRPEYINFYLDQDRGGRKAGQYQAFITSRLTRTRNGIVVGVESEIGQILYCFEACDTIETAQNEGPLFTEIQRSHTLPDDEPAGSYTEYDSENRRFKKYVGAQKDSVKTTLSRDGIFLSLAEPHPFLVIESEYKQKRSDAAVVQIKHYDENGNEYLILQNGALDFNIDSFWNRTHQGLRNALTNDILFSLKSPIRSADSKVQMRFTAQTAESFTSLKGIELLYSDGARFRGLEAQFDASGKLLVKFTKNAQPQVYEIKVNAGEIVLWPFESTPPTPPSSLPPRILEIPSPGNQFLMKIQNLQPGVRYEVVYKNNLADPSWTVGAPNIVSDASGSATWTDQGAAAGTPPPYRFYQVRVMKNP